MKIPFQISSRMVKMIGRDNVVESEGALIEIIKNSYDADSENVIVIFDNTFLNIPQKWESRFYKLFDIDELEIVKKYYHILDNRLILNDDLSNNDRDILLKLFLSKNRIYIIDDGIGMNSCIIEEKWMKIGTDNKKRNPRSPGNRILTGEKGIGRFSLDRLGFKSRLISRRLDDDVIRWDFDWASFDNTDLLINVEAEIGILEEDFNTFVHNILNRYNQHRFFDIPFDQGTIIEIVGTRDSWNERRFKKFNSILKSLNPLGSAENFNIFTVDVNDGKNSIDVMKHEIDDFDYKLDFSMDSDCNYVFKLQRNEFNTKKKVFEVHSKKREHVVYKVPSSLFYSELKKKDISKESLSETVISKGSILDIFEDDANYSKIASKMGSFKFELYYMKRQGVKDYNLYKSFRKRSRDSLYDIAKGVKIYRDNFRVRPYGEYENTGFDWLNLGARVESSPAAPTHSSGNWRVRSNQIFGNIFISRIENRILEDKSTRDGLNNPEYVDVLKEIILHFISIFELDRQKFARAYRHFNDMYDEKRFQEWKKKTENESEDGSAKQSTDPTDNESAENAKNQDKEETNKEELANLLSQTEEMKKVIENKEDVISILMSLSNAGLMTQSFTHEISSQGTVLESFSSLMREKLEKSFGSEQDFKGERVYNPYRYLNQIDPKLKVLSSWVGMAIASINKGNLNDEEFDLLYLFRELISVWKPLLDRKHVDLNFDIPDSIIVLGSKADYAVILNNFIINSLYHLDGQKSKKINIDLTKSVDELIVMEMTNNGPELVEKYKDNPDIVFEAGITSKEDEKATGVGLWMVRYICEEKYYGSAKVLDIDNGFGIRLTLERGEIK